MTDYQFLYTFTIETRAFMESGGQPFLAIRDGLEDAGFDGAELTEVIGLWRDTAAGETELKCSHAITVRLVAWESDHLKIQSMVGYLVARFGEKTAILYRQAIPTANAIHADGSALMAIDLPKANPLADRPAHKGYPGKVR